MLLPLWRKSMALNRQMLFRQRDRQAIFLRETNPRAARPERPPPTRVVDRPVVGIVNRLERRHRLWPRERDAQGSNGQNHAAHKHEYG
jgi:hypothetical protein